MRTIPEAVDILRAVLAVGKKKSKNERKFIYFTKTWKETLTLGYTLIFDSMGWNPDDRPMDLSIRKMSGKEDIVRKPIFLLAAMSLQTVTYRIIVTEKWLCQCKKQTLI